MQGQQLFKGHLLSPAQRIPGSSFVHTGNPINFKVVGKPTLACWPSLSQKQIEENNDDGG